MPLLLGLIIDERLARNVVQIANAILVDNGHFEVGQVDDQSLLDFEHTLLEHVVRLLLGDFCIINSNID